ncbi:MAG TPA: GSCFA domain-containing protein [Usitatibacter sp.]|nr:GSCFA domain-containing protein [Usitatibacter sp.]
MQTEQPSLMSPDAVIALLDRLLAEGRYAQLEQASREILSQHRFFLWHQYLIVALLRTRRREEAARELDDLISYKFNIADRAWPEIREAFPEKFAGHYVLSTMKPELGLETQNRLRAHWDVPCPIATREAFAAAIDALVSASVPTLPPMQRETTRITTFGSCFAANLAKSLKASGLEASNLLIEESVNSPLANRAFLDAIVNAERSPSFERVREGFGEDFAARARERLERADVVVITLGVAPGMFHVGSGEFAFLVDYRALLKKNLLYMRTPRVEEIKQALRDVLALVRRLNAAARIYLTISPVPLMGTIELAHAVIADCVSKSTLRAALHEVLQEDAPPAMYYWPAFEIVRWLGAHANVQIFGEDDQVSRHVSDWVVEMIVGRFSHHLFGP